MRYILALLPLLCLGEDLPYRVETVSANYKFLDGPVWSSKDSLLTFADVPSNKLHKLDTSGPGILLSDTGGASGAAIDDRGRLYVCETRARRLVRLDKKGAPQVIADSFEGKKLNGPNDIAFSKNHAYFTDPAFGSAVETRELPFYGVFHLSSRGAITAALRLRTRPNGVAITPDGAVLYVTNSDERNVRAYDIAKDGALGNERVFVARTKGVPNGIEVDEKGNVYVAAAGVAVFSPMGEPIAFLELAQKPSNLVFGDGDLKSLYVTARNTLYRIRLETTKGVSLH